jgi:ferritin-like metal-binding protein YciE
MPRTLDESMTSKAEHRIDQLLFEAHATELMIIQTLLAHIAMTPAGAYRSGLKAHLRETRDHAERIQRHLSGRDNKRGFLQVGYGIATAAVGQVVAMGKLPIDLARGMSGEEKLLKNLRDECANEAMEIAQYLAIEQYAREVGDGSTERLAASIRADEERMLQRLFEQVPRLTADAVAAEVEGKSQYNVLRTGAVDGVRSVAASAARTVSRSATRAARRSETRSGTSTRSTRPAVTSPRASSSLARTPVKGAPAKAAPAKRTPAKRTAAKGGAKRSTTKRATAKR